MLLISKLARFCNLRESTIPRRMEMCEPACVPRKPTLRKNALIGRKSPTMHRCDFFHDYPANRKMGNPSTGAGASSRCQSDL